MINKTIALLLFKAQYGCNFVNVTSSIEDDRQHKPLLFPVVKIVNLHRNVIIGKLLRNLR